jgi:hypothetical protein
MLCQPERDPLTGSSREPNLYQPTTDEIVTKATGYERQWRLNNQQRQHKSTIARQLHHFKLPAMISTAF